MANNQYDPKKDSDNWDEAPKINWDATPKNDWNENQKNDGGSGNNHYRQYTPPTGNGIFPNQMGQPPRDENGAASKTIGIIGLFVTLCFCQIAGIVMGIIGYNKARTSFRILGFESSEAATGRVLGIVNIVLGAILLIGSIASIIFTGVLTALLAGEGVEAWNFSFTA